MMQKDIIIIIIFSFRDIMFFSFHHNITQEIEIETGRVSPKTYCLKTYLKLL